MSDDHKDLVRAEQLARQLCGPRPSKKGWKLKIYMAACEGAHLGMQMSHAYRLEDLPANEDHLEIARRCAVDVLMARLPRAEFAQREKLRGRIATIKCGNGDNVPEIQSVLLALQALASGKQTSPRGAV